MVKFSLGTEDSGVYEIYISGEEETSKQMTEIISDMSVKQSVVLDRD